MNIPEFSIKHQPVVWIILLLCLAAGLVNYFTISQREDPEFKISVALVVTIWPGASAEKVEKLVTKKLEEKFEELSTVDELVSSTREALSVIMVNVDYNADVDITWQKLRNKIAEINDELPSGIIGPDVIDDFGDVTAMIYSLSSDTAKPSELKYWAKQLRTELGKINTVGKIELLGEHDEAIFIEGPLESFTLYNFSPLNAAKILDYQNVNIPAGYVRTATRNYRLEVSGSFELAQQLENAVIDVSRKTGAPLRVKDVFNVRRAYKEPPLDFMTTNGKVSVGLDIRMKKGNNLVVMGDEVRKVTKEFQSLLPPNIKLNLVHDQPRQVNTFIQDFMSNLFQGLVIVVIVMFLAMGVRAAGLIALSLPLSIILTFAIMPLFNVALETVSIAAFIIALGMLVDNAIIVTDNIDVYLKKGEDKLTAAAKGAQELVIPALIGTLATVFAFMPLLLLGEESGDYIWAMPVVVSGSLLASLILAITLIPIAAYHFLKPGKVKEDTEEKPGRFTKFYKSLMGWCLSYRYIVILITIVVFVGSLMLLPVVGFSLFPEAERDQFMVDIWLPEGASLENTENVVKQVQKIIDEEDHILNYVAYIGKGGPRFYMTIKPEFNSANYAQLVVTTDDHKKTRGIVEKLNTKMLENISGARVIVSNLWMGTPVAAPIMVRVMGPDLNEMKQIALNIQEMMKSIPGTLSVRDNVGEFIPNLKINVDSEEAAMAGITNTEVALSLLTAYEGLPVTSFREGEEEVPVYLRLLNSERNIGSTLDDIYVPSQTTGAKVPLNSFTDISTEWGPGVIKRYNTRRSVTAMCNLHGRLASEVMKDLKPKLAGLTLPKGYTLEITGEEKERNKNFGRLAIIFVLIITLIFLMLVIQFNSFKKASVLLASIPLAIIGAIIGLFASGNSFAFMPFLGVISLAGIVIKNAVVWLEFVDKELEEGQSLSSSIIEAGKQRLRPIILTAATTIGGLIPLAMFGGAMWEGMAFAMIFGLALATVLTLVVVPVIFYTAFRYSFNKAKTLQN